MGRWSHKPIIGPLRDAVGRKTGAREEWGINALRAVGRWLVPQYRFKWPDLDWWTDESFSEYLAKFREDGGYNADRRWNLYQLTRLAQHADGGIAECGVFEGAGAYAMLRGFREFGENRSYVGFDSFQGLSRPELRDGEYWAEGNLSVSEWVASHNLREFPDVKLLKGWIPDRFDEVSDQRFCMVHIDVDLYAPTLESLKFFYPRVAQGGLLICDDYGYARCPGATAAVDEFFVDKEESVVSLAAGGCFAIKRAQ